MFQGVPSFSVYSRFVTILRAAGDPHRINTAIEFSKIRQALALIEAHANYIQRSPALRRSIAPSQLAFDTRASQINDESDQSESETIPGTRGQSSRSGLYAGPTSTFSHLTTVCFLLVSHSAECPDQVISYV